MPKLESYFSFTQEHRTNSVNHELFKSVIVLATPLTQWIKSIQIDQASQLLSTKLMEQICNHQIRPLHLESTRVLKARLSIY